VERKKVRTFLEKNKRNERIARGGFEFGSGSFLTASTDLWVSHRNEFGDPRAAMVLESVIFTTDLPSEHSRL
jgi:hypothetical protein